MPAESSAPPPVVDPRAIVDPSAVLGDEVAIGPWSVIGEGVQIGAHTRIASHVVIQAGTSIETNCEIGPFAVIGADPLVPLRLAQVAAAAVTLGAGSRVAAQARVARTVAAGEQFGNVDSGGGQG